ncbi:MAG TPA: hypothetical protein DGT21_02625 [Armatimonadetes bacterium]|nr:hypothetical protein [Armatimonadota bacterium]
MSPITRYLIALILLSAVTVAAQNTSSYDLEQSEGFAHYEGLHSGDAVAESAGYCSVHAFTHAFRRVFGVPPAQFRGLQGRY